MGFISEPADGRHSTPELQKRLLRQLEQMKVLAAAQQSYGSCLLSGIRSGSKLDLDDAVIDAAITQCKAQEQVAEAAVESFMPVEIRQQVHDESKTIQRDDKLQRQQAFMLAATAYYQNNAGGQPAASTARSK